MTCRLVLHGRRGMKISAGTLEKYRQAVDLYWDWTKSSGVMLTRPHEDAGRVYVRGLEARGLRTSSVRWHLAAVKALYEALRWCAATDADPQGWRMLRGDEVGAVARAARLFEHAPSPLYLRGADAKPQTGFALPRRSDGEDAA